LFSLRIWYEKLAEVLILCQFLKRVQIKQNIYVAQNIYWTGFGKKSSFVENSFECITVFEKCSYWPTHERTDEWNYMCNSILPNHTRVTWKKRIVFQLCLPWFGNFVITFILLIICKNTLRVEQDHAPCITNPIFFYPSFKNHRNVRCISFTWVQTNFKLIDN
jgi:hypothetical protein